MKNSDTVKQTLGILFIGIGIIFLAETMDLPINIPHWILSWPMLLIVLGIISGTKYKFTKPGAYILISVGLAFIAEYIFPDLNGLQLLFPLFLLGSGIYIICGRRAYLNNEQYDWTRTPLKRDSGEV